MYQSPKEMSHYSLLTVHINSGEGNCSYDLLTNLDPRTVVAAGEGEHQAQDEQDPRNGKSRQHQLSHHGCWTLDAPRLVLLPSPFRSARLATGMDWLQASYSTSARAERWTNLLVSDSVQILRRQCCLLSGCGGDATTVNCDNKTLSSLSSC